MRTVWPISSLSRRVKPRPRPPCLSPLSPPWAGLESRGDIGARPPTVPSPLGCGEQQTQHEVCLCTIQLYFLCEKKFASWLLISMKHSLHFTNTELKTAQIQILNNNNVHTHTHMYAHMHAHARTHTHTHTLLAHQSLKTFSKYFNKTNIP